MSLTNEEAIKELEIIAEDAEMEYSLRADIAIGMAIEALSEDRPTELLDDGTLVVKVSNAVKVGRVLVEDTDSIIGGGLYYADNPTDSDTISREEAKKELAKKIPWAIDDDYARAYMDGLTAGYEIVCSLPSVSQTHEIYTETHECVSDTYKCEAEQSDLISRADAIERIANDNLVGGMDKIREHRKTSHYVEGLSDAIATLEDMPSK